MPEYFPPGIFRATTRNGISDDDWYADSLRALDEPSLWERARDPEAEGYRWLWLRSFHPEISVRVQRIGKSAQLIAKVRLPGENPEVRHLRVLERSLLPEEWARFQSLLGNCRYWFVPSLDYLLRTKPEEYTPGEDGAKWVLEGIRGGRYHVVDRWSPDRWSTRLVREYKKCCLYLLSISGIEVPVEDIY